MNATEDEASRGAEAATGWVALAGAGPGDEGLLTVRAAELLGQAGLVVAGRPRRPSRGATWIRRPGW